MGIMSAVLGLKWHIKTQYNKSLLPKKYKHSPEKGLIRVLNKIYCSYLRGTNKLTNTLELFCLKRYFWTPTFCAELTIPPNVPPASDPTFRWFIKDFIGVGQSHWCNMFGFQLFLQLDKGDVVLTATVKGSELRVFDEMLYSHVTGPLIQAACADQNHWSIPLCVFSGNTKTHILNYFFLFSFMTCLDSCFISVQMIKCFQRTPLSFWINSVTFYF